jgi:hypothetical protein
VPSGAHRADLHTRFDLLAEVVARLGHDAVVRPLAAGDVADAISRERPDVVLVGFGSSSERALEPISASVR